VTFLEAYRSWSSARFAPRRDAGRLFLGFLAGSRSASKVLFDDDAFSSLVCFRLAVRPRERVTPAEREGASRKRLFFQKVLVQFFREISFCSMSKTLSAPLEQLPASLPVQLNQSCPPSVVGFSVPRATCHFPTGWSLPEHADRPVQGGTADRTRVFSAWSTLLSFHPTSRVDSAPLQSARGAFFRKRENLPGDT